MAFAVERKGFAQGILPVSSVLLRYGGLNLDQSSLSMNENDTEQLIATVSPNDATDKTVTWESSDNDVATVIDGLVTAVSTGTATITVITENGGYTDTCAVSVS